MKIQISLFVCALILILTVPAVRPKTPEDAPWNINTIKGEHFSVALPALPTLQTVKETRAVSKGSPETPCEVFYKGRCLLSSID